MNNLFNFFYHNKHFFDPDFIMYHKLIRSFTSYDFSYLILKKYKQNKKKLRGKESGK